MGLTAVEELKNFEELLEDEQYLLLSDVDHLNRLRNADGTHNQAAIQGIYENKVTAVKEAAIPYAVSTTHQPYVNGNFYWMDQTEEAVAQSGYLCFSDPTLLKRIDVEVEEARYTARYLEPDKFQVMISPKMSADDAPYEVAKNANLADTDMVRIHRLNVEDDELKGKFMESAVVKDIPLSAWIAMLKDPDNIFGKSIQVEDENLALSVMKVFGELSLPESALPEGVLSVIESVLPYLDEVNHTKVNKHLELFRCDQDTLHQYAGNIAERWLDFETELANSLYTGYASDSIRQFIHTLSNQWSENMTDFIRSQTNITGKIIMSRKLAAKVEEAKCNILWSSAAIITDNKEVVAQLDTDAKEAIYKREMSIQDLFSGGYSYSEVVMFEARNSQVIAGLNLEVGGNCSGTARGDFRGDSLLELNELGLFRPRGSAEMPTKKGHCVVENCPNHTKIVTVGPCGVCINRCQERYYDKGLDPSKMGPNKVDQPKKLPLFETKHNIKRQANNSREIRKNKKIGRAVLPLAA